MRSIAAVALLLALVLLAPPPARAAGAAMEAPAWTAGDYWVYRFNTTFEGFVFLNGTVRADLVALRNVTVRGVSMDAFVVDTRGNGTLEVSVILGTQELRAEGTWNLTGEEEFASASRVIVSSLLDITGEGRIGSLNAPFTLHWINTTESRVVRDTWSYPVPPGASGEVVLNTSWSEDVFLRIDQNDTTPMNGTGVAEERIGLALANDTETATVPAGPFTTFIVNETWPDGERERFEYAPQVGNNARTVTYDGSGRQVGRTELLSYRYQALEPRAGFPLWAAVGIAVAVPAAVVLGAWWLRRRRAREEAYTPPSLRDPPAT